MISMNIDMSEFNALIKDLGEGIEDAIRPAAQAGAHSSATSRIAGVAVTQTKELRP